MGSGPEELLDVRDRRAWRVWLRDHHAEQEEIWLVFHKKHTGVTCLSYEDAVCEALCYGWIDSILRRIDDDRYARKFTPRRSDSKWSDSNRRRYRELESAGRLAAAGKERSPTEKSGNAPRPNPARIPSYITDRLKSRPGAWRFFQTLAPSYQRDYIAWIDAAKRPATKQKRLAEALELLSKGRKLGLK